MAPKQKITKEMILKAAFEITKNNGFENVNARSLAKEIGCSTQPIFSRYNNMAELGTEFHAYVANYFNEYAYEKMKSQNPIRDLGLAFINFAKNESNLFKLLFMTEMMGLKDFDDMYTDEDNIEVAKSLSKSLELPIEEAKKLYVKVWIFNHGIASMLATNSLVLAKGEAEKMMDEAFNAFVAQAKSNK